MSSIVSPDCRDQNHQKCPGDAWDEAHDHATTCQCACHGPVRQPIVDVIATALEAHGIDYPAVESHCYCGENVRENMPAHQAQAVLDALAEAGNVEWGIAWDGITIDPMTAVSLDTAKATAKRLTTISNDGNPAYAISRVALPWAAAEA